MVTFGGWALDEHIVGDMIQRLYDLKPDTILECGSGISTLYLTSWASSNNAKLVSLEHRNEFANKTRELCAHHEVDLRCVPIVNGFYATSLPEDIDFVLIDGPPSTVGRQKTLPSIWEHLADSFEIWLDDANRDHEQQCLREWKRSYPIDVKVDSSGKGLAIIRRKQQKAATPIR